MVWVERERVGLKRGAPQKYSEKTLFKVYGVSLLKKLWARRSLWRYLSSVALAATALKDFFQLDPLPVQGKRAASAFILLALYA